MARRPPRRSRRRERRFFWTSYATVSHLKRRSRLRRDASAGNLERTHRRRGLAALERDHVVDDRAAPAARLPAGQALQRRAVGLAPAELLEALAVCVLVRDELHARVAA